MPELNAYDRAIQELEREAIELQRRLAKLNSLIVGLKEVAKENRPTSRPTIAAAQPLELEIERVVDVPSWQKGDTTRLVLKTIAEHPGLRSTQLGDLLKDRVMSKAKNPRKLIVNAVGYLAATKRVTKNEDGGWVAIEPEVVVD